MNPILNILIALVGLGLGVFLAQIFWKAGNFKLKGDKAAFAAAGFGWAEKTPIEVIRVIGLLEVLGAIGVVLAPAAALVPGFGFAQYFGVAAAAGLALTMLVAAIMHGVRGELKYTAKNNFSLLAFAVIAAVLNALVALPIAF
jgi:DoxX-like family